MADKITFNYEQMAGAVSSIQELARSYQSAASSFADDFTSSVSEWEGETKDQMVNFINGPVTEYTGTTIPEIINALAQLLQDNIDQMKNADQQIAGSIPSSLG